MILEMGCMDEFRPAFWLLLLPPLDLCFLSLASLPNRKLGKVLGKYGALPDDSFSWTFPQDFWATVAHNGRFLHCMAPKTLGTILAYLTRFTDHFADEPGDLCSVF